MMELVERIRKAFDADSVAEKNLALRAAYDFIAAMQPEPAGSGPVAWSCTAEAIAQEIADNTHWGKTTDTYARIYQAAMAGALKALATHPTDARAEVERTLLNVSASLAAAISLLKRGGKAAKKAAPSDKMFNQMIRDYESSLERARKVLRHDRP